MRIGLLLVFVIIFALLASAFLLLFPKQSATVVPTRPLTQEFTSTPTPTTTQEKIVEPIAEFQKRITKKSFATFITPENSPVQPEKFSGYHTGVDVEYEEVTRDVPVLAITNGEVVVSRTASGYGGLMVIRHIINNKEVFALYGHLDPVSMKKVNARITAGEKIAILGDNKTTETDGERKHLHFGILKTSTVNLAGYVQNKEDLENWYNPTEFLQNY